MHIGH